MICGHVEFVLSIVAIVVAGLFAILCIIFIVIVVVKLKGITLYSDLNSAAYFAQ